MVHNAKVVSFDNSVKITEKLWIRVLECWPALSLSNEKRIDVLSVLKKKLLKKQRANFFWTTRYVCLVTWPKPWTIGTVKGPESSYAKTAELEIQRKGSCTYHIHFFFIRTSLFPWSLAKEIEITTSKLTTMFLILEQFWSLTFL